MKLFFLLAYIAVVAAIDANRGSSARTQGIGPECTRCTVSSQCRNNDGGSGDGTCRNGFCKPAGDVARCPFEPKVKVTDSGIITPNPNPNGGSNAGNEFTINAPQTVFPGSVPPGTSINAGNS